jgi:hypothetical protein
MQQRAMPFELQATCILLNGDRSQQRRDCAYPAGALLPNDHRLAAYYELRVVQKAESETIDT